MLSLTWSKRVVLSAPDFPMRKVFLTLGTVASLLSSSSAFAFSEYYAVPANDARRGVHPYDERKEALELRKERAARDRRIHFDGRYYGSYIDYYASPFRTENVQLHPFYRNLSLSGESVYDPRYGYGPQTYNYPQHPSTVCANYSFTRVGYRAAPKDYFCY